MGRRVAAFDFDGTLAKGDSLLPFFFRLLGPKQFLRSVLAHAPALGLIGMGRGDRDGTKAKFIAHALTGHDATEIQQLGSSFADTMLQTRMLPMASDLFAWHRREGFETVLVSASLDVYLQPLAQRMGFDHAITTTLEVENGKATGRLIGGNVRAAEKARLLSAWLGAPDDVELWAYGNSAGDYELLEMADPDHRFFVKKDGSVITWPGR